MQRNSQAWPLWGWHIQGAPAHAWFHAWPTRWISEDDDDEDVDGAGNNDMGPPNEEMSDYVPEEEDSLGNVDGEEAHYKKKHFRDDTCLS